MSATISIAQNDKSRMTHINDVDKSKSERFTCKECGANLIPVKTEKRGKDWHYRHSADSDISKCRSTALHDFAIQVILDNFRIALSKQMKIDYSSPKKEVQLNPDFRSDVKVNYNDEELHFEVFVTHDLGEAKTNFYNDKKIRCVRIDLSAPELLSAPSEKIIDEVLSQIGNKTLIYWPPGKPVSAEQIEPWQVTAENIILIVVSYLGIKWLVRKLFGKKGKP